MNEPIFSISSIKERARRAVDDGKPITACPFDHEPEKAAIWRTEYQVRMAELSNEVIA